MKSTSAEPAGLSNSDPEPRAQIGAGRFMVTLCTLAAPVSLRPPQSPRLKNFTFFMSRGSPPDGSEQLYLHMGYFETLTEAEKWADSVRRHYPSAFATVAPLALFRTARSEAPSPSGTAYAGDSQSGHPAPAKDDSLTDTQVLKFLEMRRAGAAPDGAAAKDHDRIELLRPEDTGTRKALKEAVIQGAPVSFAVQLHWSARPIDLSRVRSLDAFRGHTLYATETRRNGHCSYFLRLGFFSDPGSAKQMAVQVRSAFASAAVIPVVDPEITRARAAAVNTSAIPNLVEQQLDEDAEFYDTPSSPTQSRPLNRVSGGARGRGGRELRTESDSLSESGVRHLKVEVQEPSSGRWKVIRLREAAAEDLHVGA